MVPDLRMDVCLDVILAEKDCDQMDMIPEKSVNADMLCIGMAVPEVGAEQAYAAQSIRLLDGLPTPILVRNSSRFHGRSV